MIKAHKIKPYHVWLQGVVSAIFILSLLCFQSPQAEAISSKFPASPAYMSMVPNQLESTRETCTTDSLTVSADATIRKQPEDEAYGQATYVIMAPNKDKPFGGLFQWDFDPIPSDAIVFSASLTFHVTQGSDYSFGLYNLKRAWTEHAVTWLTVDGTNPWGAPGAAGESDRYDTNLWDASQGSFKPLGLVTIELNDEGIAVVQGWLEDESSNHGFTIQNYTGGEETDSDRWIVTSKEHSSPDKPKLNICYFSPSATPTVRVIADSGQSKVYGEDDPTLTYTASDQEVQFTGELSRAAGENSGIYAIDQGNLAADGYEIVFVPADFTINTRPIEVTADNVTKAKGSEDPDFTYQTTSGNLVGTDSFTGKLERVSGEDVGEYAIHQGTLAISDGFGGNNYQLTFISGTLTITDVQVPPELPSAFHGEILYVDGDNAPGETEQILAFVDDVDGPVGNGNIFYDSDQLVYLIDVLADDPNTSVKDGGVTGDTITFIINGRIVAMDTWQGSTNKTLHIHPPFASTGGPYVGLIDEPILFKGDAQDLGEDIVSYAWDLEGDGSYADAFVLNPSHTYTTTGARTISLRVTDQQGGQGTDSSPVVIMALEGLSHNYDGTPKSVTVTGVDLPYTYTVTYDGETQEPSNAGTYEVIVEVKEGNNIIGEVTREMTISSNEITVTADAKTKVYGEFDPDLTYTWTGELAEGDELTGELSRIEGEAVGSYEITQGSLTAGKNYVINYTSAQLTITPRPITVKANDHIKLENENDPIFTYEITTGSLVYDDSFTGILERETGEAVGFYAIEQGSLGITGTYGDQNYAVTFNSGTLIITTIQEIDLATGWNLVSFSLQPISTATQDVLESIEGKYTIVYVWDATSVDNDWIKYDPNSP